MWGCFDDGGIQIDHGINKKTMFFGDKYSHSNCQVLGFSFMRCRYFENAISRLLLRISIKSVSNGFHYIKGHIIYTYYEEDFPLELPKFRVTEVKRVKGSNFMKN